MQRIPHEKNQVGTAKQSESSMSVVEKQQLLQRKATLTVMLSQVCILQRQYGKTKSELEGLIDGMLWALVDFEMTDIINAIRDFVREDSNIPTPSDIIKIIRSYKATAAADEFYNNIKE